MNMTENYYCLSQLSELKKHDMALFECEDLNVYALRLNKNSSVLLLKKNEKKLFLVNLHIEIIFNFVEILLFNQIINFYL